MIDSFYSEPVRRSSTFPVLTSGPGQYWPHSSGCSGSTSSHLILGEEANEFKI